MLRLAIMTAALSLGLAACRSETLTENVADVSSNASVSQASPPPPGARTAASNSAADPSMASEMLQLAAAARSTLPIRIDAITQTVDIRAQGTEMVWDMRVSQAFPPNVEAVRQSLQGINQTQVCASPMGPYVRRGATARHVYTDTNGATFSTLVTSCP